MYRFAQSFIRYSLNRMVYSAIRKYLGLPAILAIGALSYYMYSQGLGVQDMVDQGQSMYSVAQGYFD